MSNIKDFEEFARNSYELISERDSLKEEKQNKEISYLTFENSQTESEEDLEHPTKDVAAIKDKPPTSRPFLALCATECTLYFKSSKN